MKPISPLNYYVFLIATLLGQVNFVNAQTEATQEIVVTCSDFSMNKLRSRVQSEKFVSPAIQVLPAETQVVFKDKSVSTLTFAARYAEDLEGNPEGSVKVFLPGGITSNTKYLWTVSSEPGVYRSDVVKDKKVFFSMFGDFRFYVPSLHFSSRITLNKCQIKVSERSYE